MISLLAIDQNKKNDFLRDGGGSIGSEELGQVVTVQVDLLSDWKKRRWWGRLGGRRLRRSWRTWSMWSTSMATGTSASMSLSGLWPSAFKQMVMKMFSSNLVAIMYVLIGADEVAVAWGGNAVEEEGEKGKKEKNTIHNTHCNTGSSETATLRRK